MGLLTGKKAVIFGVDNKKSIAYAIAKRLKEEGCELGFTYAGRIMEKRVRPISEELGGKFCIPCDVTLDEQIIETFGTVEKEFGRFDILIHSVAFAPQDALKGRFIETTRPAFRQALDISAYSLVALARHAEPLMNDNGTILTMSYLGAVRVVKNYNVMGVAKAALESITRYLAEDLGERNIRVNAISAGPIRTMAASGIGGLRHILSTIPKIAPLHRNVSADDVAGNALYLVSDLSQGVTGEVLYVDAGYSIVGLH